MRGAAGAVSITTLRFASQPTASWFRNGGRFPPQDLPHRSSKHLAFPRVIDPAAPPIRPERHVPNSIATMRRRLTVALGPKASSDVRAAQLTSADLRTIPARDAV